MAAIVIMSSLTNVALAWQLSLAWRLCTFRRDLLQDATGLARFKDFLRRPWIDNVKRNSYVASGQPLLPWLALACVACAEPLPVCSAVIVTPDTVAVAIGDSSKLAEVGSVYDNACSIAESKAQLRWSSADPTIVRVDSLSGVVHGVAPGSVDIRIRVSGNQTVLGAARVVVFTPLYDRIVAMRGKIICYDPLCDQWSWHNFGLATLATDGSDVRVLRTGLTAPDHPRVSPDGRWVVYEDYGALYLVDGAGVSVYRVPIDLPSWSPSWSPDGRWILFLAQDPTLRQPEVFKIAPHGLVAQRLTSDPFGVSGPAWSPNGTDIVFVRDSIKFYNGSFLPAGAAMLVDTSGANLRVVNPGNTPFDGREPQWSNDGKSIVFLARPFITLLDLATNAYDTLTQFDTDRPATWSPDNLRLLVSGRDIYYFSPTGKYPNNPLTLLRPFTADSMISVPVFYTPHAH
jgi:hypothetical protein